MKINRIDYEATKVVVVEGYLGGANAGQLESFLAPLLSGRGPQQIVIDLAGVTEMSSAGLRVLISAIKRARSSRSGDIRLAAPSARVIEVLELAGLSSVIQIYPSREEAVASFDPSAK